MVPRLLTSGLAGWSQENNTFSPWWDFYNWVYWPTSEFHPVVPTNPWAWSMSLPPGVLLDLLINCQSRCSECTGRHANEGIQAKLHMGTWEFINSSMAKCGLVPRRRPWGRGGWITFILIESEWEITWIKHKYFKIIMCTNFQKQTASSQVKEQKQYKYIFLMS